MDAGIALKPFPSGNGYTIAVEHANKGRWFDWPLILRQREE
jgi:hypothetical protein